MNTKDIEETLKEQAKELKTGDQKQKEFGERLLKLADEIGIHRKRPLISINQENAKDLECGKPKWRR